jgi:hypothetical protein
MSQPQASFYAESYIDPDILQPDDLDIPSSQPTLTSIPTSHLTHPLQSFLAPTSLTRVGPRLRKCWVLFDTDLEMEQSRHQFVQWWLTTGFGLDPQYRDGIKWGKKKISDVWKQFEQVANERTGEPKVMCKHCFTVLTHPNTKRTGTSTLITHLKGGTCRKDKKPKGIPIDQMVRDSVSSRAKISSPLGINGFTNIYLMQPQKPTSQEFSQSLFQEKLLNYITAARVPFRTVEHREFKELLQVAQLSESKLNIPSTRTIRRCLDDSIQERQQSVLSQLPEGGRLSIALDCWTSPFSQAFMAITGYFIDKDWNYCEVLLGFEPLYGSHTGTHLSETVIKILTEHGIADRLLSITTDNASNNNTMMIDVQEAVHSQALSDASIFRIPCIAHVIQLSLNQLLGRLKAVPVNKEAETEWSNERTQSLQPRRTREITDTLKKVGTYTLLFPFI